MKNVLSILKAIKTYRVHIRLEDNNLKLSGATKDLPLELISEIKQYKSELIEFLSHSMASRHDPISKAVYEEFIPMTNAQQRIWFVSQFDGGQRAYSIVSAMIMRGDVDLVLMEKAFNQVVARHESLRTTFHFKDDRTEQRVHAELPIKCSATDLTDASNPLLGFKAFLFKAAEWKFDLENGPLLKVDFVKIRDQEIGLVFNIHHIVSDGWSMGVLIREVMYSYEKLCKGLSNELPELSIQYQDYTAWLQNKIETGDLAQAANFWRSKNLDLIESLDFPSEFVRPSVTSFQGDNLHVVFSQEQYAALTGFCTQHGVTQFAILNTLLNVLIHRYAGRKEFIVGTPVSGRNHHQLEDQIGLYVNTIPLVAEVNPNASFLENLHANSVGIMDALNFQNYPVDLLLEDLKIERKPNRNALFDIVMVLQNNKVHDGSMNVTDFYGFRLETLDSYLGMNQADLTSTAKFDLMFTFGLDFEKQFTLDIEYATDLFGRDFITCLSGHFMQLFDGLLANPNRLIREAQIMGKSEREAIVGKLNPMPIIDHVPDLEIDLSLWQSRIALSIGAVDFSYSDLGRLRDKILTKLGDIGSDNGAVVIALDRNENAIASMLACIELGMPYCCIDLKQPEQRVNFMIEDMAPACILTDLKNIAKLGINLSCEVLTVDNLPEPKTEKRVSVKNYRPAYYIYTSGSTGKPKAVELTRKNVASFLRWCKDEFAKTDYDSLIASTSFSFDISTFEILYPLTVGKRIILAQSGLDIPEVVEKEGKEGKLLINTVPSVVRMLLDAKLDWSNVKALNMAGEAVPVHFLKALDLHSIEIRNLYGPSEDTTFSTCWRLTSGNQVYIGKPIADTHVYILDEELNLLPEKVVGEICLTGLQIANGYKGLDTLTAEKFVPNPFEKGLTIYRTGDLGKMTSEGQLIYIGRKDHQIKLRGYRIELGEISSAAEQIPGVKAAIAALNRDLGEDILVLFYEGDPVNDLRDKIERLLPEYMVPTIIQYVEKLPLNSNGKIDRKRLPAVARHESTQGSDFPMTHTEQMVAEIWQDVLGHKNFNKDSNFFSVGGHSIRAVRMRQMIWDALAVQVSLADLFIKQTICQVADLIDKSKISDQRSMMPKLEDATYFDISGAQRRLWVLTKFEEASTAYHMPVLFKVSKEINVNLFEIALSNVIARHESLRTNFVDVDGVPKMLVHEPAEVNFSITRIRLSDSVGLENELIRLWKQSFDLAKDLLFRVWWIETKNDNFLSFNMHHMISDGASLLVLVSDTKACYESLLSKNNGLCLPALKYQYRDCASWLQTEVEALGSEAVEFWRNQFKEGFPVLELPTTFNRPAVKTYNGSSLRISLDGIQDSVLKLSNSSQSTIYMTVLSLVTLTLSKLSSQQEVVVGVPVSGRPRSEFMDQIGFYVNTIPLKVSLREDESVSDLIQTVKSNLLACMEYQYMPFDEIVLSLDLPRDLSRNPLFDVCVVMQNAGDFNRENIIDGFEYIHLSANTTKYDLTWSFSLQNERFELDIEYNTDIFSKNDIQLLIERFTHVIASCGEPERTHLSDLSVLLPGERARLVEMNDATCVGYNKEETIISIFNRIAKTHPERIAVSCNSLDLTYHELGERSSRLAGGLIHYGVKKGDLVVVLLDRSVDMIIALIGVLKAGAAYVPIDPAYPEDRIRFILEDSGAKVVISDQKTGWTDLNMEVIDPAHLVAHEQVETCEVGHKDLAYVIYTSGTTGAPKGVMIEHGNVTRLIHSDTPKFDFQDSDTWTMFHSFCFDFSVWEMYGALLTGGKLIVVEKNVATSSVGFLQLLQEHRVSILNLTPSAFRSIVFAMKDIKLPDLRYLIFGGEKLSPSLLRDWMNNNPACHMINMYGITETTVHVTHKVISQQEVLTDISNIGTAIPTLGIVLLDKSGRVTPPGVHGEIHVYGAGVGRGYLNRLELTQERFVESKEYGRMYRSGDVGRYLQSGEIEYIGRNDHQLKIRGYRIEPAEIEQVILTIDGVSQCIVLAKKHPAGDFELVAYYVGKALPVQLRETVALKLPPYMIPQYFVPLTEIPLTVNGKLDLNQLPDHQDLNQSQREIASPRNELDEKIVKIWKEVLDIQELGITDNFFELGGHSLKAIRIMSLIQQEIGVHVDLKNLFIDPTVKHLSNYVEAMLWSEVVDVENSGEELVF